MMDSVGKEGDFHPEGDKVTLHGECSRLRDHSHFFTVADTDNNNLG
jgi:hypothetical protein